MIGSLTLSMAGVITLDQARREAVADHNMHSTTEA